MPYYETDKDEEPVGEKLYETILVKDDGTYLGWEPGPVPEDSGMKSIEWNKPLPDDVDNDGYIYTDGELIKPE